VVELRRSARLLWSAARRDNPRLAATAVGIDIVLHLASRPLWAVWLKLIVDGVAGDNRTAVVVAGAGLAVSFAVPAIGGVVVGALMSDLHESSSRVLIGDLMELSAGVPGVEHHERPEYADRVRLIRDQSRLLTNFVGKFGSNIGLVTQIVVTVGLLASVHPALFLLPALAVPSVWAGSRANAILEKAKEETAERVRLEEHIFTVVTTPGPAKESRIFNVSGELVDRHRRLWSEVTEIIASSRLRAGLVRTAGWLSFAAGYVGAVVLAVSQARRGAASPGDVLLVIALAGDVNAQVGLAATLANDSAGILRGVRRLLWLSDYAAAARVPHPEPAPAPDRMARGITLEGVGFRYPGTDTDVLAAVDVELPAGSVVAVVGENGVGKTTLVKLLTRCYDPTAGRITVDGVDLRRLDVDEWRARLSAGFQDFVRFELLLRESVGVGDLARIDEAGAVVAALRAGQAADLAAGLPAGLDSQLGKQFDGGSDLSEGQWQKVAISRALMQEAPLLLVLDEPTSGLDADAEHALFERYAAAAAGAAREVGAVTVLISHRFSTVRLADHIVVLDGGRVVEQGCHAELVAAGGLYAELYGLQARAYR
jgi:ATP-binding cassette, subfamily B, bacterial